MDDAFFVFAIVGFIAQLIDGALGMAYGTISSTVLLSFGVSPAVASASVHTAEVFTTGASAIGHIANRNVAWRLLAVLATAGAVGGSLGAYVLTSIPGEAIKPLVTAYLACMGGLILWRAVRGGQTRAIRARWTAPLGVVGGFLDSVGGGGWGATVTGTLIGAGGTPRQMIGTANTAEFFVSSAISVAFLAALLSGHWKQALGLEHHAWAIGGLILGGVLAAPLAGFVTRIVPAKLLMAAVGVVVAGLAIWQTGLILGA